MKHYFYPSFQDQNKHTRTILLVLIALMAMLLWFAISALSVDPPFLLLDIDSRALYVDEGFYADAAQNLKKFGQWDMPLDSRHWPGAPFMAMVQSVVFFIFGVSLNAARMISIILSLMSGFALYAISRSVFTPLIALGLTLSAVLTFNYIGYSRAAIADPIATSMSMLALLVFVRLRLKEIAIPLSLFFAYMAFLSKMYFLFSLVTIGFLWAAELILLPVYFKTKLNKRAMLILFASVVAIAGSYLLFRLIFSNEVANFLFINGNKTPELGLHRLYDSFDDAIEKMPYHTKSPYFLKIVLFAAAYFIITRLWPPKFRNLLNDAQTLGRAEWALGAFFCSGFILVGMLSIHKAHYHYFTILPLAFLAIASINLMLKSRIKYWLIAVVLALHLFHQLPYYQQWIERTDPNSIADASWEMAKLIDAESNQKLVPIIGEYSSQLALYSDKLMSLDAKWGSGHAMCKRVAYWRPQYHVNVVWPTSDTTSERDYITRCNIVSHYEEIARYPVFKQWNDEIVLSRLIYAND